MFTGDLPDALWHGGGKEGNPPRLGGFRQNGVDIVDEPHSQHFIGFIKYCGIDLV